MKHDYTLGQAPELKKSDWPLAGGMITGVAPDEFYVVGNSLVATAASKKAGFSNATWTPGRLTGNQGRHIRLEPGSYAIQHVKLYTY